MSNISQFTSKDNIQEQASIWISRLDRGLSADEKVQLESWLATSDAHKDSLFKLAKLWDDLSVLNELSDLFPLQSTQVKTNSRFIPYAMTASFAAMVLLSASLLVGYNPLNSTSNDNPKMVQEFQTALGEQASFSMPDGTSLQLNTNSLVQMNYSENQRRLTLVKGEAKFEVAKDISRPFTVTAGDKSFTALGTIFNVQKNTTTDLELIVTEGKVLITEIQTLKQAGVLNQVKQSLYTLAHDQLPGKVVLSGEQALIENNHDTEVVKISPNQIQRSLAWQQGMLIFDGDPLKNALAEVARYTSMHFQFSDSQLENIKVSGYFKANDIDGLLHALNTSFNITHQQTSPNSILLTSDKT